MLTKSTKMKLKIRVALLFLVPPDWLMPLIEWNAVWQHEQKTLVYGCQLSKSAKYFPLFFSILFASTFLQHAITIKLLFCLATWQPLSDCFPSARPVWQPQATRFTLNCLPACTNMSAAPPPPFFICHLPFSIQEQQQQKSCLATMGKYVRNMFLIATARVRHKSQNFFPFSFHKRRALISSSNYLQ